MKTRTKYLAILTAAIFFLSGTVFGLFAEEETKTAVTPLEVVPEPLEIGTLGPGGHLKGIFFMKSNVSADMKWSTRGPSGWTASGNEVLSARMKDFLGYLDIGIIFLDDENVEEQEKDRRVEMVLESEGETLTLVGTLPMGDHLVEIPILFEGGEKIVSVRFETALREPGPEMSIEPPGLDFGVVEGGTTIKKKLKIKNTGKGALNWKVFLQGNRGEVDGVSLRKAIYISFLNEDSPGGSSYEVPARLSKILQLEGPWLSEDGYPASNGGETLRMTFTGTGIAVIVRPDEDGGKLRASVDGMPAVDLDCSSDELDRIAVVVADNIAEGTHVLTLINDGGYAVIEGVRIYGNEPLDGVPGWVDVFPKSGTSRGQTNYVTVTVQMDNLKAGRYSENIVVQSNAGMAVVDASIEVRRDAVSKIIDIYRYVKGNDYLYTGQTEMEDHRVLSTYRKQKLAFRLFREETPGTRKFHRWYSASRGDHYYSCDPQGGGKSLQGYVPEGFIGYIATSRILGTRELYRWYNPSTGCHFYTTDVKGEGMRKKGYRFEGIAGYVR